MTNPTTLLRRLGSAGARDNAFRSCEEHRLAVLRIEALGRKLARQPALAASSGDSGRSEPAASPRARRTPRSA